MVVCRLCRLPLVIIHGVREWPTNTHDATLEEILIASIEHEVPVTHLGQIDYIFDAPQGLNLEVHQ